jgi:hypothetical protein
MEFLSLSRVCLQKLLNLSSTRLVLPYLCQTAPFLEQLRTAPRRPKPGSPTACCCCGYLPAGLGCARLVMAAASVAWGASAPWAVAAAPTGCARQWLRRWHGGGSWATLSYETSLGPLLWWVPRPTTRWVPVTTRFVSHGT